MNTQTLDEFIERIATDINAELLEGEMYRIHSDLAYANARYAETHRAYLTNKLALERVDAVQYLSAREQMVINGAKFTEKVLASTVIGTVEYVDAREAYIEAEVERERMKGICMVLGAKKDMLVSIGMRINAELKGNPTAAAQSSSDREARGHHGTG